MSDLLGIGYSGLKAYSRALSTIGDNIANAQTPGYARRRLEMMEAVGGGNSIFYRGNTNPGGVDIRGLDRSVDAWLIEDSRLTSGDAELAHRGEAVGGARVGHFAEIVGRARSEDIVAELRLAHRRHQLAQDHGLERLGRLAQPAVAAPRSRGGGRRRNGRNGARHMITSSAVSAPAWLSASRMATRSPGETPSRLIESTSSESEALGFIRKAGP